MLFISFSVLVIYSYLLYYLFVTFLFYLGTRVYNTSVMVFLEYSILIPHPPRVPAFSHHHHQCLKVIHVCPTNPFGKHISVGCLSGSKISPWEENMSSLQNTEEECHFAMIYQHIRCLAQSQRGRNICRMNNYFISVTMCQCYANYFT